MIVQPRGDTVDGADQGAFPAAYHSKSNAWLGHARAPSIDFGAQLRPSVRRICVSSLAPPQIVEGALGDADDVVTDKGSTFARAVLRVFKQHSHSSTAQRSNSWPPAARRSP